MYTNDEEEIIFVIYKDFRKSFLERFTDPNPAGTAMEKLLNLRRGKMKIQEYAIKSLNLAHLAGLGKEATKALVFRKLHSKDQERMMLVNSIKTETEFQIENVKVYLERIIRLLRREEVRRQDIKKTDSADSLTHKAAIWRQKEDSMELDTMKAEKEIRKCFKCRKTGYI